VEKTGISRGPSCMQKMKGACKCMQDKVGFYLLLPCCLVLWWWPGGF